MRESDSRFDFIIGSDVQRDGMFVELKDLDRDPPNEIAEVFYSDVSGVFTLSCYVSDIPLGVVEKLIAIAKDRLPPARKNE